MHLRFNFDVCPMHSPFGFVHLTHQNLSARALFCLNSLAKVNTQLLIYNCQLTTHFLQLYKVAKEVRPESAGPVEFVNFGRKGYGHKHICDAPELPAILK